MFQANGYDVLYRDGAFKTVGSHKENPLIAPSGVRLRTALDYAIGATLDEGDGRWIITRKYSGFRRPTGIAAGLMVFVPRETGERTLLLAAVDYFEGIAASYLGAPVDTAYRSIEEDGPKCDTDTCGKKPTWARVVRMLRFSNSAHFCNDHAEEQKGFPNPSSSDFFWRRLEPPNT
jgi:hypothetical protein